MVVVLVVVVLVLDEEEGATDIGWTELVLDGTVEELE